MTHLSEPEFVDWLDGELASGRAAHLRSCSVCAARASALESALDQTKSATVSGPSPLFWDHLSARIMSQVETASTSLPRAVARRLPLGALRWGAIALVAIVGVIGTLWRVAPADDVRTSGLAPATEAVAVAQDAWVDDIEADQAWGLVRAVAEDVGWEGTREAGITVRPETADRVVTQLSTEERSELARLIEEELRRSGA